MTEQHPITPPPELVEQWAKEKTLLGAHPPLHVYMTNRAAQWGADQELEVCCELLPALAGYLRNARRPKPTTLKEQALELVSRIEKAKSPWELSELETIRRALEALND
jgi:hypothetical protein